MKILDRLPDIDENFKERPTQKDMANFICNSLNNPDVKTVIVEGAVGIGKSLGYLFGSLVDKFDSPSCHSLIISTSGIVLQEQLINKDLPFVSKVLEKVYKKKISFMSLKGIGNYLCIRKFDSNLNPKLFDMPEERPDGVTPEEWALVSSDYEECLGSQCSHYRDCFHKRRKKEAESCDILVVNHYLLAMDVVTSGKVLPRKDAIIVDEAHNLERSVIEVSKRALSKSSYFKLLSSFDSTVNGSKEPALLERAVGRVLAEINHKDIEQLVDRIKGSVNEGALLDKKVPLLGLMEKFSKVSDAIARFGSELDSFSMKWNKYKGMLSWLEEQPVGVAIWWEKDEVKFLDVAVNEVLKGYWLFAESKQVFASATLTTNGNFDFIKKTLGIGERAVVKGEFGTPFNIEKQMKTVIVPKNIDPRSERFFGGVIESIDYIVDKSPFKKTLILCTSNKMMDDIAEHVQSKYSPDFLVLVQTKAVNKLVLLEQFSQAEKSILIGQSASFGEGVDVHGNKNIIITKINFTCPDSPIQIVKERLITFNGGNAFSDLYLPEAVLRTKQQVGRGIRTSKDNVVLAILDGRVLSNGGWGRIMRKSLPRITHTCPFLGGN